MYFNSNPIDELNTVRVNLTPNYFRSKQIISKTEIFKRIFQTVSTASHTRIECSFTAQLISLSFTLRNFRLSATASLPPTPRDCTLVLLHSHCDWYFLTRRFVPNNKHLSNILFFTLVPFIWLILHTSYVRCNGTPYFDDPIWRHTNANY